MKQFYLQSEVKDFVRSSKDIIWITNFPIMTNSEGVIEWMYPHSVYDL